MLPCGSILLSYSSALLSCSSALYSFDDLLYSPTPLLRPALLLCFPATLLYPLFSALICPHAPSSLFFVAMFYPTPCCSALLPCSMLCTMVIFSFPWGSVFSTPLLLFSHARSSLFYTYSTIIRVCSALLLLYTPAPLLLSTLMLTLLYFLLLCSTQPPSTLLCMLPCCMLCHSDNLFYSPEGLLCSPCCSTLCPCSSALLYYPGGLLGSSWFRFSALLLNLRRACPSSRQFLDGH